MKEFFVTFSMVLGIGLLAHACIPSEVVKSTAYGAALAGCRDAGTYDDYEQCALDVDAKFGVKR